MANEVLNPILKLDSLFPTLNDESFLQFLKEYYKFLQSTKITLVNVSGTYVKGETVVGFKSKAFGTVLAVGENELIVLIKTEKPFESNEILTGATSGATGNISFTKDNVIRESARLQQSRSQYVSDDEFFQLLRDEVNRGYPSNSEADRRALYNRIRDLFQSKSTEEAYRFLFKSFFDESVEIRFPGDDLLRVSDGKFEKTSIIRVIPENTNPSPIGGIFDFFNKTIRGQNSGAVGTVVNIQISFLGGIQYAEFNLKLVSGEFEAGETIADVLQPRLSTQVFAIIGDIQIIDGGSGYSVEDEILITGDGSEATAVVSSVSEGPINRILVNTPGIGYRLNTRAIVNNSGTGGEGLAIDITEIANTYSVTRSGNTYILGDTSQISIINRGSNYVKVPTITLIDTTIQALGLLSERLIRIDDAGEDYSVGDILTFTGGAGSNAAGIVAAVGTSEPYGENNLLFEDNFVLMQEQEVNGYRSSIKNEDWSNLGSILRIELTNLGDNYTSANLPTLTIEAANTVSGFDAQFTVLNIQGVSANVAVDIANNAVGIGSIRQINILNPGINYSSANADITAEGDGNAILSPVISGIFSDRGFFVNDDSKINFKIIQDSLFYQDFSYVIRSGLAIDTYKNLVKETVHPAGLEFFGEILIFSYLLMTPNFISEIKPEKIPPLEIAIKSLISLYELNFNQDREIEIDVTPETIDVVLMNDREIEIDITPETIDVTSDFDVQAVNPFIEPYVNLAIDEPAREVTVFVPLNQRYKNISISAIGGEKFHTHSNKTFDDIFAWISGQINEKTYEIDITPETIDVNTNIFNVGPINRFIELYVDMTMAFYSEIVTLETDTKSIIINITLETQTTINASQEIEIDITPETIDVTSQFNIQPLNYSIELEKVQTTPIEKISVDVKVQSIINTPLNEITENITFGELQLFSLANELISPYSLFAFEDTWISSVSVKKNIEASGTVNTVGTFFIGTNTNFEIEFAENRSIIINNEKFIIKNVANSSHLEVNVTPATNYTNSVVYREFYT